MRSGYEASVEAGLRRLESEKLKFLSTGSVFSKFDPETVAAFEPQIPPHERDANDATHDDFLRDAILSDDIDLDKTTAFDKGTSSDLSVQSVATVTDVEDPDSEDASAVSRLDTRFVPATHKSLATERTHARPNGVFSTACLAYFHPIICHVLPPY